jgi:hypothetical protein
MSSLSTYGKQNYIILTSNKINKSNEGTKILMDTGVLMHTGVLRDGNNEPNSVIQKIRIKNSLNNENIIILSFNVINPNTTTLFTRTNCLLTLNNIKNNIKFLFTESKKNGTLVFIKSKNSYDINKNYLIDNLTSLANYKIVFNLNYYFNNINNSSNFYKNASITSNPNYDFYKLNMKDYLLKDYSNNFFENLDLCYNNISFMITNVIDETNTMSNEYKNNLYRDNNVNNFNRLSDISDIDRLYKINNFTTVYNNIYNKYTSFYNSYYKNIKYIVKIQNISKPTIILSLDFNTFLIKTNNFDLVKNAQSKIVFDNTNSIYFLNVKVSSKVKPVNFSTKVFEPYIIFLSLGDFRTGLTQSDIYKHTAFTPNMETLYFRENITSGVINTQTINVQKKHNTLIEYINNNYLYDNELSSNILLKTATFNTIYNSANKILPIEFNKFFSTTNIRNFYNTFNNLAFVAENSDGSSKPNINYFINPTNYNESSINFNILYIKQDNLYKRSLTNRQLLSSNYSLSRSALLDLRFNYNSYFYIDLSFNINYNYPSLNPSLSTRELINNSLITVVSLIYTIPARDFTDVECIYIYHNPYTDSDPAYRYPNNNIEIIRDPSTVDTLSKAIELLPGARSSTSNSIIIPEKNASNYSRKMIQGLIGLNNIPKLLSIQPYDPNVIVGRGFIDQYQIDNECLTSQEDIVKNKINANKHSSAKDSQRFRENKLERQNFANLVRSNRRNRISQQCIENLRADNTNNSTSTTQINYANIVPYTPRFKIFKTGKGHYL